MDRKIKIAIIGGGIAGLALATNLVKNKNLDVYLFESAPQFSEIGAGISFGANAVKAIHLLGLGQEYESIADQVKAPYQDIWFQWRNGYTDEYLSASLAPEIGQSSVHRADFLDALIPLVDQKHVHFNKRVKQVVATEESAKIFFEEGDIFECDYVIGSDGIHSVVRQHVLESQGLEQVKPRFSGTWAYRGIVKYADYKQEISRLGHDPELADVPQMLLGHDKHILTFPIRQGEEINIVAFKSDRNQTTLPDHTPWTMPTDQSSMLKDFHDWGQGTQALLNLIDHPTIWALHEIEPLETYQNIYKNVILIGDAAHAMLPHQGAGAGQGLEDALILAQLFSVSGVSIEHLSDISSIYEEIRKERAIKTQNTSRESGEIYELYAPQFANFTAVGEHLIHRFDWLWQHDLEQDVLNAKTQLNAVLKTQLESC
ncbi:salicylate 1-monooxygenase [Acinetobacter sp. 226-4]|uniref:salicylate 1-monooxygenase n=1 Tax=Acinetobacter sp. 226-4 TaxID=2746719 RepID=UPI00257745AD|nr:salicylate 1-monooxygenase [Acinetobacter sp. 226-4]MDM1768051.1 salicylate 1-monooxygenase [Acinetobacter sp. 226-4]